MFSAGVSGIINHLPCHQPLGAASTSLHPASDHHTSPHLPQRLSWMGAMSPSNPVSGIWTPSRPGSLRPPHLPPVPLFVAPRSRKPRKETAYQRALLVLIAPFSSLAEPTPSPFGPQLATTTMASSKRRGGAAGGADKKDLFHVVHKVPAGDSPYVVAKHLQVTVLPSLLANYPCFLFL